MSDEPIAHGSEAVAVAPASLPKAAASGMPLAKDWLKGVRTTHTACTRFLARSAYSSGFFSMLP
jgi:hypothetical protein